MRMKGGVRRFQTGGVNPQAIQNPGMAAVMNSPQMQANLAAARATPPISGAPAGGAQSGAFTAGAPANGLGSAPGLNPQAIQQALQQRRSMAGGPPAPGGPAGAPAAGWPGQGGAPPQGMPQGMPPRPPQGMPQGMPQGGTMGPMQGGPPPGGMPQGMPQGGLPQPTPQQQSAMTGLGIQPGMAGQVGGQQLTPQQLFAMGGGGGQMSPQAMQALMAARQQQGAAPGMAEGGPVKQDGDTVAKKRRPAPQWGASKAAEDIPTVEKKARGGAIKRRKPPAAKKPKLPPMPPPPPGGNDEGPDVPPPAAGPAMGPPAIGGAPGMKKGGKWIQDMHMKEGALHKQLGVPEDKKIPKKKLNAAAKKGGKLGKRAQVAKTLSKFNKGGKCDKMAAGGAMKVRRGFPNTLKAPKKLAAGGAVRLAKGGKVRGCGVATKGCNFSGIY